MKKTCPITAAERSYPVAKEKSGPVSEYYGEDTFNIRVMKGKLPGDAYDKIIDAIHENTILDNETANTVAHAMAKWATRRGRPFCHWVQPCRGSRGEARRLIDVTRPSSVIERFSASSWSRGAGRSSFPSGASGNFVARGTRPGNVPAFIRGYGISDDLCIPTAFISIPARPSTDEPNTAVSGPVSKSDPEDFWISWAAKA
jgi:glutamine synthetase